MKRPHSTPTLVCLFNDHVVGFLLNLSNQIPYKNKYKNYDDNLIFHSNVTSYNLWMLLLHTPPSSHILTHIIFVLFNPMRVITIFKNNFTVMWYWVWEKTLNKGSKAAVPSAKVIAIWYYYFVPSATLII